MSKQWLVNELTYNLDGALARLADLGDVGAVDRNLMVVAAKVIEAQDIVRAYCDNHKIEYSDEATTPGFMFSTTDAME